MTDNDSSISQNIQVNFYFWSSNSCYHFMVVMFQVLNFCCHLCGASYATRTCYWSHFQKCSQSNSLPTKCQICSKEFDNDTPSVFYYHMRRKHHNIIKHSWFACSLCGKLFPTEEVLNTHTKTHFKAKKKKEDSWLCEFCSHAESSEEAIIAHTQLTRCSSRQNPGFLVQMLHLFHVLSKVETNEVSFISMWQKGSFSKGALLYMSI